MATTNLLRDQMVFDVIVIGAGAAGSYAALLFAQLGMRVLVLDAGRRSTFLQRPFSHILAAVVKTVAHPGWYRSFPHRLVNIGRKGLMLLGSVRQPRQCQCFAWELDPMALVDDRDHPYSTSPGTDFAWYRAHGVNGRMTVPGHGLQFNRFPDESFDAWPISVREMAPWYAKVSDLLELAPQRGGQGDELSPAESVLCEALRGRWPDVELRLGRSAPWPDLLGRAGKGGDVAIRSGAFVRRIDLDKRGNLRGVTWVDSETREDMSIQAPVVFTCASTIESTRILLNSKSADFPDGIGADGGALGKYLMDHIWVSGQGRGPGLVGGPVEPVPGRCLYAPRLDLHAGKGGAAPLGMQVYQFSLGEKRSMFTAVSFSEMEPREDNEVTLHPERRDANGIPIVNIAFRHSERELRRAREQSDVIREIARLAGAELYNVDTRPAVGGTAIHECGTARMGAEPKGSVLDPFNQVWDIPGLYVTDGACFPTVGPHNLTLTIMALTARAVAHVAAGGEVGKLHQACPCTGAE